MTDNSRVMENQDLIEKKFSILQEISTAIVATDNISSIANLILDLAINYTNAEKGSLMLINEQGELYIHAARGIDIQLVNSYRVKIGEGIAGTVAKNRLPVLVEDIENDKDFKDIKRDRYKTKSFISCPLISKKRLLGILNINDKKDNMPFTDDEFALLKIIANQAAITLENVFIMSQFKAKAADLEEINRKLIDTDVMKTEFITRVSHELRSPLNSIKGAIYCLKRSEKLSAIHTKEFYDIISTETNKLITTVENLLDFQRLEDNTQIIKKSIINLPDFLNEILNSTLLKTSLTRKNLTLKLDIKENLSSIVGDKIRIAQFFINLIEGLIEYIEKGDSIGITVNENDYVNINLIISRSLPSYLMPNLFDSKTMFHKNHREKRLKLYLAYRISKIHRWDLNAENKDDTFVVSVAIPKSTRQKIEAVIDTTMTMFNEFIADLLYLNICSIMLTDELTGTLSINSAIGLDEEVIKRTRIKIGDSIAGRVALEGRPLLIDNVEDDTRFKRKSIPQYNTKSLLSVPLKINDRVVGVVNLNNKKSSESFTERDLHIASVVSERISHFIETLYSSECREGDFNQFITSLDSLLTAKKKYRKKDSILQDLMNMIMDKLEASEEAKKLALYISMIYDIGLALVDEDILNKKELLPSETTSLRIHPYTAVDLINKFEFSEDVKKAILYHHEKYDGTGYPERLKGEEIPFISRVLSVADAFCAMITERPYRKALTKDNALKEIKKGSGSIYDPKVVKAFEEVVNFF